MTIGRKDGSGGERWWEVSAEDGWVVLKGHTSQVGHVPAGHRHEIIQSFLREREREREQRKSRKEGKKEGRKEDRWEEGEKMGKRRKEGRCGKEGREEDGGGRK